MPATKLKAQEDAMLRAEIEMLMGERQRLLKLTGAAAFFVANLDYSVLPDEACEAARMLSNTLNSMPEETLREALETVEQELMIGD